MNILEQEIEDVIWEAIEHCQHDELRERGLPIYDQFTYYRQLHLGNYGRADLVGVNATPSKTENGEKVRNIYIQIFELKKGKIDHGTLSQAVRYAKGLQHQGKNIKYKLHFYFHLVGKSVDLEGSFPYFSDLFFEITFHTYSISLTKGIVFERRQNFYLTNPSFSTEDNTTLIDMIRDSVNQKVSLSRDEHYFKYSPNAPVFSTDNDPDNLPF